MDAPSTQVAQAERRSGINPGSRSTYVGGKPARTEARRNFGPPGRCGFARCGFALCGPWWTDTPRHEWGQTPVMGAGHSVPFGIRGTLFTRILDRSQFFGSLVCAGSQCARGALGDGRSGKGRCERHWRNRRRAEGSGFHGHKAAGVVFAGCRRALHAGAYGATGTNRGVEWCALAVACGKQNQRDTSLRPARTGKCTMGFAANPRPHMPTRKMGGGKPWWHR